MSGLKMLAWVVVFALTVVGGVTTMYLAPYVVFYNDRETTVFFILCLIGTAGGIVFLTHLTRLFARAPG